MFKQTGKIGIALLAGLVFLNVGCQSLMKKQDESFKPMAHTEETLGNGMKILWIEDAKLPYYSMQMILPIGGAMDPQGKDGVSHITASLLDKGTSKRSATRIADELASLGLSFGAAADEDSTTVGISGLSIHAQRATQEFYDLLTQSNFSEAELQRQIVLTEAQIRKMFDNPKSVASLALEKSLYGSHPYAKMVSGNLKTLKGLKRADVMNFYKSNYQPSGAVMAVVGRFGDEEKKKVRDLFSSWKGEKRAVAEIPAVKSPGPQVIFVEKSGLKQAEIRFGHIGIARNDPDYLKLRVANTILGESFIGRLFSEIREKRGLTYSIGSYFDSRLQKGPFVIATFTRLDKIPEMIAETQKVVSDFSQGVSERDVNDAVAYLKGSFPQVIETGDALARQLLILYRYGVDPQYLAKFMAEVSMITPAEINGILKTHFRPQDFTIVVYGPPGSDVGLEKFGKVTKIKPESLY